MHDWKEPNGEDAREIADALLAEAVTGVPVPRSAALDGMADRIVVAKETLRTALDAAICAFKVPLPAPSEPGRRALSVSFT